jgi:hypothetical protein
MQKSARARKSLTLTKSEILPLRTLRDVTGGRAATTVTATCACSHGFTTQGEVV